MVNAVPAGPEDGVTVTDGIPDIVVTVGVGGTVVGDGDIIIVGVGDTAAAGVTAIAPKTMGAA
jgi:hypothetical protein